jgi:hypothetical protein
LQNVSQKSDAELSVFWQDWSLLGPEPHVHAPLMQVDTFWQFVPVVVPPDVVPPEAVPPEVVPPDVPVPEVPELLLLVLPLLQPAAAARARMAMASVVARMIMVSPRGLAEPSRLHQVRPRATTKPP